MPFLQLIAVLVILGLIVWAIQTIVPMAEPFKRAVYVVSVIICVFVVLSFFGLLPMSGTWGWHR